MVYRIVSLALVASVLASFGMNSVMLGVSRMNYPGAEALRRVHELGDARGMGRDVVRVHSDTLSCSTGITRFMERKVSGGGGVGSLPLSASPAPTVGGGSQGGNRNETVWIYDKTEDPEKLGNPKFWEYFDYVLVEDPKSVPELGTGKEWEVVDVVHGFAGVKFVGPGNARREDEETPVSAQKAGASKNNVVIGNMYTLWRRMEGLMKRYVTNGWWIQIKMEPKIRILQRKNRV